MKKVLVIGENSYIGKSFEVFAKDRYDIKMVSSRNDEWKSIDFTGYDSILHCAGIAHVSRDPKMKPLYYAVNCDLAVNIAKKAKSEDVRQFIFLSSILVYGSNKFKIDMETPPNPADFYGGSKLKAEQELQKLVNDAFKLCIIRPPMVYGKGCRGNFPKLVKLAKITPIFPDFPNKRSMIYIDNLCSFFCKVIDSEDKGIFLPQNQEYVNTTELVKCIAECQNKRISMTKLFNPLIRVLTRHISVFEKLFGDLCYTKQGNKNEYNIVGFQKSIKRSLEDYE